MADTKEIKHEKTENRGVTTYMPEIVTFTQSGGIAGIHHSIVMDINTLDSKCATAWNEFVKKSQFWKTEETNTSRKGLDLIYYTIEGVAMDGSHHRFVTSSLLNSGISPDLIAASKTAVNLVGSIIDTKSFTGISRSGSGESSGSGSRSRTRSIGISGTRSRSSSRPACTTPIDYDTIKDKKGFTIRVGECVTLRRRQNASTGYSWHIALSPGLELVSSQPEDVSTIPGATAYERWTVQATKPASNALVYLLYKRSWEPDSKDDTQERIHITIVP